MVQSIGFIGGGQMAEAIIRGLLQAGLVPPEQIAVAEPAPARRELLRSTYRIGTVEHHSSLPDGADAVVLAVKPQVMETVLREMGPDPEAELIITVAAGLKLSFYERLLGPACRIIRAMPNMAALILAGATAVCRNERASDDDLDKAVELFSAIGLTVVIEERLMDAVTGLSGSGPAFVFSFVEAMIDGGVKMGLPRETARDLAIQTVLGAARTIQESGLHPAVLRDRVTSPGGTTACGLHALESAGFRAGLIEAVEASCRRSGELGEAN